MPRETVVHGDVQIAETPADRNRQNPDLSVNWNREGEWVQVAIVVDAEYLAEYLSTSKDTRLSIPTEVLTRQQINHLIRTLRRARDAAYGSDE